MNDDLDLLASAYLDGDLDDAARADAEADPAFIDRVAELRAVRDAVASVDGAAPAPARTRDAVLASALAAYDELHAEPDHVAAATGPVTPLAPRRGRSARWLGAVAAATVVAAGIGVVVATVANQDDDESAGISDAAVVATDAAADERLEASAGATSGEQAPAEEATGAADTEAPTAAAATAPAGTTTEPDVAEGGATLAAPTALVVGESNLAAYADQARRNTDEGADDALSTCGDDRFADVVGTIDYATDPGSQVVRVVVVLDGDGGTAYAVEASSCDVVAAVEVDGQD
jgi:hypothetical protein